MDDIINSYYKNGDIKTDEVEIIFNSNSYKRYKIPIHQSGLFFDSNMYLSHHINKGNNKTTATSYEDFNRLISVLKNNNFKMEKEEYILSIGLNNNRIRITNLDSIKEYCNVNKLPSNNIEYIKKELKNLPNGKDNSYVNNEYNFRINYKTEKPLDETSIGLLEKSFSETNKSFRYIKRYTFSNNEEYPFLKFDFSIVKSKNGFKTLKETNIFKSSSNYEIEMELINKEIIGKSEDDLNLKLGLIKNIIKLVFSTLQNTNYPITELKKYKIIKNFHKLVAANIGSNGYREGCLNNNKSFFGPGSVALQKEDLNENTNNNILKNYCITDKADGIRKFIYINNDDEYNVYLIDMNMNIQFTGLTMTNNNLKNTIIDGEHLLQDGSNYINLFLAFDIYYLNNKMISNLKFYSETMKNTRYIHLVKTIDGINDNITSFNAKDLKIQCKTFEFCNIKNKKNIFKCCKNMFNHIAKLPYKTDGLIFTPTNLRLKEESRKERDYNSNIKKRSRWNACYKWKEPRDNTIDFLIKIKETKNYKSFKANESHNKTKENIVELYVGKNIMDYKMAFWKNGKVKKEYDKILFNPKTYNSDGLAGIAIIKQEHNNDVMGMYTEDDGFGNREYIGDDTIVEFRYGLPNGKKTGKNKWIPIRVRHDKTLQYKNENSNFGNNITTAINNWRSINEPVTKEVLIGDISIEDLEKVDYEKTLKNDDDVKVNAYWNPKIIKNRNKLKYTKNLREFHNQIKYELLKYCSGKLGQSKTLFDMTCGKGGDLTKWINNNYKYIVGFDLYEDSITNNEDGIYQRAYKLKDNKKFKNFPNMIFEQGDAAKNYLKGDAFNHSEKENIGNDIIKCVMGKQYDQGFKLVLEKFEGIAKQGFDVISNQFSIHYFFKNINTLTGFIQNISECCKMGGYFIGTCFDGKTLFEKLKKSTRISKNNEGHKIFEIDRIYNDEGKHADFLDDVTSLGYPIDVYMESIGIKTREYLVNFNYFITIMRHYGFTLEKVDRRHDVFKNGSDLFEKLEKISYKKINIYKKLSTIEKEISFNNRYFIFKKTITTRVPANITEKLKRGIILDDDLLKMIDGGYELDKFSKKQRKKDNNFNGLPEVLKNNNGFIQDKFKQLLKSTNLFYINLHQEHIENNYEKIKEIYGGINENTFLILDFVNLPKPSYVLDDIENILLENDDIIYYGIISREITGDYIPCLIFKKGNKIIFKEEVINEFNPIMTINKSDDLYLKNKMKKEFDFNVFNDCPLLGGTKQRALVPFISRVNDKRIIYAGPTIGFAQVALAKALNILHKNDPTKQKKQLILYFNGSKILEKHLYLTKNLIHIYDNIFINIFCNSNDISRFNSILITNLKSNDKFRIIPKEKNLNEIQDYVKKNELAAYIVPFGLRFPGFVNLLSKQIIESINNDLLRNRKNMRIWLVAGSGAILNSLYKVFPNAEFVIVEVGHTIYDDVMELGRTTKYNYSKVINKIYNKRHRGNLFNDDASIKYIYDMPYDTVNNYDAKVWPIFKHYNNQLQEKHGRKENFIWNVACTKTYKDIIKEFVDSSEKVGVDKKEKPIIKIYKTKKKIII